MSHVTETPQQGRVKLQTAIVEAIIIAENLIL